MQQPLVKLTVVYVDEPDEVFEFNHEGQALLFGRDEQHCEIVIWSAINGKDLSRVAGRIWRSGDELWLRNLSTAHDLYIEVPAGPPLEPLAPRRDDRDPGPACALPGEVAIIRAPGGCELQVTQIRSPGPIPATTPADPAGEATTRLPQIPTHLRPVAVALCGPLLAGQKFAASYNEIAARLGDPSYRRIRRLVSEVCRLYGPHLPAIRQRDTERAQRDQAELELPGQWVLRHGVWTAPPQPVTGPPTETVAERRRRALDLPDYNDIAHLLVRRGLVTVADIRDLPPNPPHEEAG